MTRYTVKIELRGGETRESIWTAATSEQDAIEIAMSQLIDDDKARVIGATASRVVEHVRCTEPDCAVCALIANATGSAA